MIERIFGGRRKWTSSIGSVLVVLLLAISCTAPPTAQLPGAPSVTNTPAPTQTQPSVYNPTTASPQPSDTSIPTVPPPVRPTDAPSVAPTDAPTFAPTASDATASEIRNFALENLTIVAGTTVTWTNRDGASHTATSGAPQQQDGIWDSQVLSGGGTFSFTFNEPGVFPYFCRIHNSMRATVTVSG